MYDVVLPQVPTVSVEEVKQAIETKESLVLLDVRTPDEVSRGKLPGAINVPLDELLTKIVSVVPDKKTKIYVYCMSGSRSVYAVDAMIKEGYTNVYHVANGVLAWRVKKYPVE